MVGEDYDYDYEWIDNFFEEFRKGLEISAHLQYYLNVANVSFSFFC